MKILVTGAAGFIGSALIDLIKDEHEIRAVDNFSIGNVRQIGHVEVENVDVAEPDLVDQVVQGQDIVVHFAGYTGIPICENNPEAAARNVLIATKLITDASVKYGVKQVLFPSTFAVYGIPPEHITEQAPIAPIGLYGNLKAACEYVLLAAQKIDGLNTLIFRQSNIYGKGLAKKSSLLNVLTRQVLEHEPITMYGTGEQVRNFLHVRDTARAYKLAIERGITGIYNLGGSETISVRSIIDAVNETAQAKLGYTVPVETKPDRGAAKRELDLTSFDFDISKAEREIGFKPELSVRYAIEELLVSEENVGATA